jgi:hypothetical protein
MINKLLRVFSLSKRQKFVLSVIFLASGIFISEFFSGVTLAVFAVILGLLSIVFLYFILRSDIRGTFSYPIFILPFLFTVSFVLFYLLVPPRLISRLIITGVYAIGLYSLYLTQNIFAVSAIRTITLMRSARIVSFVLTIIVLFLLSNIIFSLRLPIYLSPVVIFVTVYLLSFQSLWSYNLNREAIAETSILSAFISVALVELSIVLNMWPINASIYSIFITGIFYAYSGLCHAWVEKRLFKGILWEYVWVGFLSVIILIFFSKWGL